MTDAILVLDIAATERGPGRDGDEVDPAQLDGLQPCLAEDLAQAPHRVAAVVPDPAVQRPVQPVERRNVDDDVAAGDQQPAQSVQRAGMDHVIRVLDDQLPVRPAELAADAAGDGSNEGKIGETASARDRAAGLPSISRRKMT